MEAVGLRAVAAVLAVIGRAVELDDGRAEVRLALETDGFLSSTELVDLCEALEDVGPRALVDVRTVLVGGLVGGLLNPPVAVLETEDDVGLVVPVVGRAEALAVELVEPRRLAGAVVVGFLTGTFSFFTAVFFAGLSASVVSTSVAVLSPAVSSPAVSPPEVISLVLVFVSSCDRIAVSVSDLSAILFFLKLNRNFFVGAVIHQK